MKFVGLLVVLGFLGLGLLSSPSSRVMAQPSEANQGAIVAAEPTEEYLAGEVIEIIEEGRSSNHRTWQKLLVRIDLPNQASREMTLEYESDASRPKMSVGNQVVVTELQSGSEGATYVITDYVRHRPMMYLALLFIGLTVVIARWRGVMSLLGMAGSFVVILFWVLPQLMAGHDPVVVAISGAAVIIPVTFIMSHGLNRKTGIAILGTLLALILTGVLSQIFIELSHLSGFASEEANFIEVMFQGVVNVKGLLLAGIIIGTLGILDDVTVSQSSIVMELQRANPKLTRRELYLRAMRVGSDHIASTVNTLILVYTGAALPLLLLFVQSGQPTIWMINMEVIAEEIVRTLTSSIGLIAAVPITTLLAVLLAHPDHK